MLLLGLLTDGPIRENGTQYVSEGRGDQSKKAMEPPDHSSKARLGTHLYPVFCFPVPRLCPTAPPSENTERKVRVHTQLSSTRQGGGKKQEIKKTNTNRANQLPPVLAKANLSKPGVLAAHTYLSWTSPKTYMSPNTSPVFECPLQDVSSSSSWERVTESLERGDLAMKALSQILSQEGEGLSLLLSS